jgi:hypothetical protein
VHRHRCRVGDANPAYEFLKPSSQRKLGSILRLEEESENQNGFRCLPANGAGSPGMTSKKVMRDRDARA